MRTSQNATQSTVVGPILSTTLLLSTVYCMIIRESPDKIPLLNFIIICAKCGIPHYSYGTVLRNNVVYSTDSIARISMIERITKSIGVRRTYDGGVASTSGTDLRAHHHKRDLLVQIYNH